MTQLNVPGSSGVEGPIAVYELVPTSAVAADQGAFNLYKVEIGGSVAVLLDNRQGGADLMVQFFLQNSPIGQPFVYFLQAGEREVFNLKSPIDFMVLSNMSGTYPLPLGFAQLVTQRQPQATTGYILISGMDSEFDLSSPNVPAQQVPIDHGTVASAGTVTKRESVPPDANSLIVLLSNPTNVIELKVVGVTTGTTYIDVGLGFTNPAGAVNAIPIGAAYDAQVDITVTQQGGPALSWWLIGRQDFPNEEVTLASGATILIGGGNVNAVVTGNVGITAGSSVSVTGSSISVTGGSITVSGNVTSAPGTAAPSSGSSGTIVFANHTDVGAAFAFPSKLFAFSASLIALGTGFGSGGGSGTMADGISAVVGLKGQTSLRFLPLLNISMVANWEGAAAQTAIQATGFAEKTFPFPIDLTSFFQAGENVKVHFDWSQNGAILGVPNCFASWIAG